jgi:serine/threonine protein kinase
MSYCLNPHCQHPKNPIDSKFCLSCGRRLKLRDRYRAVQLIGQGGFGRTFQAIDEDKPSHPVCVIKQFYPQVEGTAAVEKAASLFTQEAIALEKLNHPHIPKLLAYFITEEHHQYLVQEFIDGQNLRQEFSDHGVMNEPQIIELLNTLLIILDYIHRLGFIHRDLKPENIIRDRDGRLYLVDFGAAKTTATSSQTHGTTIGTPEFMAPEQGWGKAFPSSDLYSLGVTSIHLLTGLSPFNLFDDTQNRWIWRDLLPHPISEQIANILDKLIQPKPIDRYESAAAVLVALQANNSQHLSTISLPTRSTHTNSNQPSSIPQKIVTTHHNWDCIYTFDWHNKPINSIALFADGKYLVSGDEGGTVAVWNLSFPQPIATYCINHPVCSVAASPNHSQIATGDKNRKVQIRRREAVMTSMKELHVDLSNLDSHGGFVYTVQFSPDGQMLASGGADSQIRLWNADTGKIMSTLDGHDRAVTAVRFMPKGQILISAGSDGTIRFWDLPQRTSLKTIQAHTDKIHDLAISQDGKMIVSGSSDRTIGIRQLGSTNHQTFNSGAEVVLSVAISRDQQMIAAGLMDGTIQIWDLATGNNTWSWPAHQAAVKSLLFTANGNNLITASWDRTIKLWQSSPLPSCFNQ